MGELKIAIVHDELTRRGGAEVVLEEMIRTFPEAEIFSLYSSSPQITVDGKPRHVKTTFLQHLPMWFRRHPSRLLPLLPFAAEQLDLSGYDVVISSSSAFAKAVVTRARIPHVCYCHTPTRYLWERRSRDGKLSVKEVIAQPLMHYLRLVDFAAAQRVDKFIANSDWTKQRISSVYRKKSSVVYPPIDTSFFTPPPREQDQSRPDTFKNKSYFLCVGRITPSKKFDQAIEVFEKLEIPLVIAGTGYESGRLKRMSGKFTKFTGRVTQEELRLHYWMARAVIQPGVEDFGMVAAEAIACGTPVVAFGDGGIREIVRHGENGILYRQQTVESLAEAVRKFLSKKQYWHKGTLQQSVFKFSKETFRAELRREVEDAIALGG